MVTIVEDEQLPVVGDDEFERVVDLLWAAGMLPSLDAREAS